MKRIANFKNSIYAAAFVAFGLAVSCTPDEVKDGNPIVGPELDATFSATSTTPTIEDGQTVTVTAASSDDPNVLYHLWRRSNANGEFVTGTGLGDFKSGPNYSFTFMQAGTFKIRHTVVGYIGGNIAVSEQSFTVDIPQPEFGPNVVTSPNFETASDWSIFQTSNEAGVTWTINGDSATASGGTGNYPGAGIWQAVELEEGEYIVDMHAEGAGATDTWFEVYIGTVMPQDQTDYSNGGIIIGLNTWTGCGNTAFDGQLADISCVGSGNPVTIPADGTYYLVIKTGSGAANGVNNITISDVTLKKVL